MIDNNKKGHLLALLAGISWGFLGVFVKILDNLGFDSMTISAFRPTIGVIFYLIVTLVKNPKCFKTDLKGLLFFAFYGIFALDGMFIASSYAVKYTGVATASVLLFINPIIVVVLSYFIFKEEFTIKKFIALILAIVGCCLVVRAYDSTAFKLNLVGIIWGILSGVAVALQNVLGKIAVKKYSYKTHLVYSFLFGAIFLWFFVPPWTLVKSIKGTTSLINILGLGFVATLIPNEAMIKALQYIESGKTSIIASVEPVVASILAFIIFDELFELPQFIGMILIIASIILIQLKGKEKISKIEELRTAKKVKGEILFTRE
ncbi:DMT family transporter [Clostridium ganghwense]|uniref:DMT family transporter n=1 Tax=Clostridium ganghwense TaxID=312089 RepID=A0ABT4CUH3_9CLOT|nr:DMT family transporter [Clostridium ganghwense]MCY6371701.1 DMT family transporter [Clostridium ganghwense]